MTRTLIRSPTLRNRCRCQDLAFLPLTASIRQRMPLPTCPVHYTSEVPYSSPEMPQPSLIHEQPPVESAYHELTPAPITFPLPPSRDVIGPR